MSVYQPDLFVSSQIVNSTYYYFVINKFLKYTELLMSKIIGLIICLHYNRTRNTSYHNSHSIWPNLEIEFFRFADFTSIGSKK